MGDASKDARELGPPDHVQYTIFLEVANADHQWIRRFHKGVCELSRLIEHLADRSLAEIGEPLVNYAAEENYCACISEYRDERRKRWAKEKARVRQVRHRAKKSRQKA